MEEDAPHDDEDVEADKGNMEVLSDRQVASNGNEGQEHTQIQNTLTGVSHIFGMHEETDAESDTEEKIQSIWQKWHPPRPKEDTPSKELIESSSEEEQPTDGVQTAFCQFSCSEVCAGLGNGCERFCASRSWLGSYVHQE